MVTVVVIGVVSGSLVVGAVWGIHGNLPDRVEGFIVALAAALVIGGAVVFAALDHLIKQRWGGDSGGGLLAAITLDGIPENLALGVALISTGPLGAAALSGSILLSNLPEAAGGAREMSDGGRSKTAVLALWTATAVLLTAAALAGNLLLGGASDSTLGLIRGFAGGAVVGSLAIEVFPKAFKESGYSTGLAVALGLVLALYLDRLG